MKLLMIMMLILATTLPSISSDDIISSGEENISDSEWVKVSEGIWERKEKGETTRLIIGYTGVLTEIRRLEEEVLNLEQASFESLNHGYEQEKINFFLDQIEKYEDALTKSKTKHETSIDIDLLIEKVNSSRISASATPQTASARVFFENDDFYIQAHAFTTVELFVNGERHFEMGSDYGLKKNVDLSSVTTNLMCASSCQSDALAVYQILDRYLTFVQKTSRNYECFDLNGFGTSSLLSKNHYEVSVHTLSLCRPLEYSWSVVKNASLLGSPKGHKAYFRTESDKASLVKCTIIDIKGEKLELVIPLDVTKNQ